MQFRDLKTQYKALELDINNGIQDVINNTSFILGKPVTELENRLAEYVGRKYCVSCASGTDALYLSLKVMNIGVGDAVFTSDFTYFASAGSISIVGATPILVDIDLSTFNISPEVLEEQIQKVISEGKLIPKAIIPVDLFGLPADYTKIIPIAEKYGLMILEDAAQGFGGGINGKLACSFGEISATSFFPAKPLGCYGDGGAIFTDNNTIAERLHSLRANGRSPEDKYDNREVGINSRLDTLQAAILLPKLKAFVEHEIEDVNRAAVRYTELLKKEVVTPDISEGFISSWAQYTIMLKSPEERAYVQKTLKEHDVPSMIYYPRGIHQQGAYKDMNLRDEDYPNTVEATKRVLSLPIHPYLKDADIHFVTGIIKQCLSFFRNT